MKEIIDYLNHHFETNSEEILSELFEFLRFQSISTDPQHQEDILTCANWVSTYLKDVGFSVVYLGSGNPCIFAEKIIDPSLPTVLVYNHYDVQPVDPIDLWHSPPFEPVIKDGEIYARGAEDNKGQCYYVLRTLKALNSIPDGPRVNIKLLIEGEEECGSKSLPAIFKDHGKKLAADYLFVVDFGFPSMSQPAITLGCRGIVTMTLEVEGSNGDLHSGEHGGIVFNPLHALVEILGKLRSAETGEILIPEFYDSVVDMTADEKKSFALEIDPEFYRKLFNAEMTGGEKAYSPLESAWLRPTLEINGISGGYAGPGFKTVIPAKATAKISARLVPDQDPQKIATSIVDFLRKHTPEGINLKVSNISDNGDPFRSSANTKAGELARKAYEAVMEIPCKNIMAGGSIPIVASLVKVSGAEPVLMGFGLPDDQIHAPNEHFGIDRIKKGMATFGAILSGIDKAN